MAVTSSPGAKRHRISAVPFSSDPGDMPIVMDEPELFPGMFSEPNLPDSSLPDFLDFPAEIDLGLDDGM